MKTRSLLSVLCLLSSVLCLGAAPRQTRFAQPRPILRAPSSDLCPPIPAPSVAPAAPAVVPSAAAPAFVPITKAELIRVFQRYVDQAYLRRSRLVLGTTPADPVALQDCETEIRAYMNAIDHAELLPDEK